MQTQLTHSRRMQGKLWASACLAVFCGLALPACDWTPGQSIDSSQFYLPAEILPGEIQLIHISTDAQANSDLEFRLVVDTENEIQAFRTLSQSGRRTDFPAKNLDQGIVLLRASGRDIVKLSSRNFDTRNGGSIQMTYLNDGVSGKYRNFQMELVREGSSYTVYANERTGRRKFSDMFLKKNESAFLGVIGIADVVVR